MDSQRRDAVRVLVFLLTLAVIPATSFAGDRDHADGFFLRLSAGIGTAKTELAATSGDVEMSGGASDVNLAIGAVIAPNLALHGTLLGWMVSDPDVKVGSLSGETNAELSMTAIGAGLTYYIMPLNLYLSGTLGLGSLELEYGRVKGETESGLVVDATIGKEWWVGRKWGLGVAAGLGYHSISEKNIDESWKGTSFAIRFSATMN